MKFLLSLLLIISLNGFGQCDTSVTTTASSITTSGATITTSSVTGVVSYTLKYVKQGLTDTVSVASGSPVWNLTGLTSSTIYRYYVSVLCSGGIHNPSVKKTFTTLSATVTYTPQTAAGYTFKRGSFDSTLHIPFQDTTLRNGLVRAGAMVMRPSDSSIYAWNGTKWNLIGGSTTALTALINAKVDSVTTNGDTLYYWKQGVSYGEVFDMVNVDDTAAMLSGYVRKMSGSFSSKADYSANYGSTFTSRSLIDKGYADSADALRLLISDTTTRGIHSYNYNKGQFDALYAPISGGTGYIRNGSTAVNQNFNLSTGTGIANSFLGRQFKLGNTLGDTTTFSFSGVGDLFQHELAIRVNTAGWNVIKFQNLNDTGVVGITWLDNSNIERASHFYGNPSSGWYAKKFIQAVSYAGGSFDKRASDYVFIRQGTRVGGDFATREFLKFDSLGNTTFSNFADTSLKDLKIDVNGLTTIRQLSVTGATALGSTLTVSSTATIGGKTTITGVAGVPLNTGTSQTGVARLAGGGVGSVLDFGMYSDASGTQWIQAEEATNLSNHYPIALNPNGGAVTAGGTFSAVTSVTAPKYIGGTSTTSTVTIQPTSGVGTTGADIIFKNGNNGATEAGRILHSGNWGFGVANPLARIHASGTAASPAASGTTPTGGVQLSYSGVGTQLNFGALTGATGAHWIQTADASDLSIHYPLMLNPIGGQVIVGSTVPDGVNALQVTGSIKSSTTLTAGTSVTATTAMFSPALTVSGLTASFIPRTSTGGLFTNGTLRDNGTVVSLGASANAGYASSKYQLQIGDETGDPGIMLRVGSTGTARINVDNGVDGNGNGRLEYARATNVWTISAASATAATLSATAAAFPASVTVGTGLTITTAPTTSAATYDILTRNASTGVVEKIASSVLPTFISNTGTLDFGSTAAQSSSDITLTVTGAVVGDVVALGVPDAATLINSSFSAWVSATNTVKIRFNNYSSGTLDPASATFKVTIIR